MRIQERHTMALILMGLLLLAASVGCRGIGNSAAVPKPTSYALSNGSPAAVQTSHADLGASPAATSAYAGSFPKQDQSNPQFCPVTGAKLGSMGEPVPVAVGGETVYVCCAACVAKVHADPQRYLRPGAGGLPDQGNGQGQLYRPNNYAQSPTRESSGSRGSSCSHCSQ